MCSQGSSGQQQLSPGLPPGPVSGVPFPSDFLVSQEQPRLGSLLPCNFSREQKQPWLKLSLVTSSTRSLSFVSLSPALVSVSSKLMLWNLSYTKSRTHRVALGWYLSSNITTNEKLSKDLKQWSGKDRLSFYMTLSAALRTGLKKQSRSICCNSDLS